MKIELKMQYALTYSIIYCLIIKSSLLIKHLSFCKYNINVKIFKRLADHSFVHKYNYN